MKFSGEDQIYWTGAHFGEHVCNCHYSEDGCFMEDTLHNTCNCDSKEPSEFSDVGVIMNSTALPIMELRFGGLTFEAQTASHTLGKLECYGKKSYDAQPGSCSDLKKMGIFTSGFYNVRQSNENSKLVFCDMASEGYDDVPEEFIESSETHSQAIEQTIADFKTEANDHFNAVEKSISDIETHSEAIEQTIADFETEADNHFTAVEKAISDIKTHSEAIEQSIADFETEANNHFATVEKSISDINAELPNLPGKWSGGSYCILANGDCPSGFNRYEGYLHALNIYSCNSDLVKEVFFGDSSIKTRSNCQYNHVDIDLTTCCK